MGSRVITLSEARDRIGSKVVYRAPHVKKTEKGEEGVITPVNDRHVFVRYGPDTHAKATHPALLELVTPHE